MTSSTSSSIRAIVFDFDGVILESADVKTEAFVKLYEHHGTEVVARVRDHHLANLGVSRFKKFAWIAANVLGESLDEQGLAAMGDRFAALALQGVLDAPFVPGADRALAALQIPAFVASGTPHDELQLIVDRRELRGHFREVHGSPAEKPAILADIMSRCGWRADEVLFVGDGMTDYKAAVAAGVQFLARDTPALHDDWVRLGVRREPDLTRLGEVLAEW